jgi:hypothetical protein
MTGETAAKQLVAEAQALLGAGRPEEAIATCRRALAIEPDCLDAHLCMAHAKLPGEDYLVWLRRLHERLRPRTYLEIGVDAGRTLGLARPPTIAVGVDPAPAQAQALPLSAQTRVFAMESDAFFASRDVAREFGHSSIDLAFIDGLHLFEQALKDFIHVERHTASDSVVLFHDCLPLTGETATRDRRTGFWTGDVWKIVPILERSRPDLTVFVIATYPTGLGVVTRLDPTSRVLDSRFEEIVAEFIPKEWNEESEEAASLPIVPNDWAFVERRLRPAD